MEASVPLLSAVIVTHNVASLIGDCIASLLADCRGLDIEVFVVDSASSDGTVEVVRTRFPQVTVMSCDQNVGFSAGNNLALRIARGRFVLLINPDTVTGPGAIRRMLRRLQQYRMAGAAGPLLLFGSGQVQVECARHLPSIGNLFQWLLLLDKLEWKLRFGRRTRPVRTLPPRGTLLDRLNLLHWDRSQSCAVASVCGACMLVRADVLRQVGLLDEASPLYLDDIDLCRRIRDAGWEIHFVADAEVVHLQGRSTQYRRAGDIYAMQCHSIWLYLRKHEGRWASTVFAAMVGIAGAVRVAVTALPALVRPANDFWRRQLHMSTALLRWALQFPKTPPRLGFASEEARQPRR